MAIAKVQTVTGTGVNPTINFSAAGAGNLLLLFSGRRDGTTTATPSGWTLTPAGHFDVAARGGSLFYKEAAGGETSVVLAGVLAYAFEEYSGVDATTVVDSATSAETSDTDYTFGGGLDPGSETEVVLWGGELGDFFGNGANWTPDAGTTEVLDTANVGDEKPAVCVARKIVTSPSGNQDIGATCNVSTTHQGTAIMFGGGGGGGGGGGVRSQAVVIV